MSVFRIFKGGTDYEAEYKGTAIAGEVFGELWGKKKPDGKYAIKPGQIYEELIFTVIKDKGCDVEYNKDGQNFPVKAVKAGGKKILYYERNGEELPIDLKVVQDDDDDDVIYMVVPYKRDVTADAPYLADAVNAIKTGPNMTKNKEFLFGMLLLKRCR
jgi:hypothetical protein